MIRIRQDWEVSENSVTPEALAFGPAAKIARRAAMIGIGGAAFLPIMSCGRKGEVAADPLPPRLSAVRNERFQASDKQTHYRFAAGYNNFYELGVEKTDPRDNAMDLKPRPWTVVVEGACAKPGRYDIDDLLKVAPMEERLYRMRCVEGWSMVIPWIGFPLSELLKAVEPTQDAKYVTFTSINDPKMLPKMRIPVLKWPYREGLRMDEAMHPLTLLSFGIYGRYLPNQNGAPVRLVVPWKYGFKSIKSIVGIKLVNRQPQTSWNMQTPDEYGFYSNVNPEVDHPRWSQQSERRIGEIRRRDTQMFNGYASEVAHLYKNMDLKKFY